MLDVVVNHADFGVVAVVLARDVEIQLRERIAGQRLAFLGALVHPQLEFGELRLTEHRGLDVLQIAAEQRQPHLRIGNLLQLVIDQQRFVER